MVNKLTLFSGIEIPFAEAGLFIHQPPIIEIAYIGEENFFIGCELLNFSKNFLSDEDKIHSNDKSDFQIFIAIMNSKNSSMRKSRACAVMVLSLMFPDYEIAIKKDCISFSKDGETRLINEKNFQSFKEILVEMFHLNQTGGEPEFNPQGDLAKSFAEKILAGRRKAAKEKGQDNIDGDKTSLFMKFISILSVGENKDVNVLMKYTVFQLFNEFNLFMRKQDWDMYIKARLAGATDLQEVPNWMSDNEDNDNSDYFV